MNVFRVLTVFALLFLGAFPAYADDSSVLNKSVGNLDSVRAQQLARILRDLQKSRPTVSNAQIVANIRIFGRRYVDEFYGCLFDGMKQGQSYQDTVEECRGKMGKDAIGDLPSNESGSLPGGIGNISSLRPPVSKEIVEACQGIDSKIANGSEAGGNSGTPGDGAIANLPPKSVEQLNLELE